MRLPQLSDGLMKRISTTAGRTSITTDNINICWNKMYGPSDYLQTALSKSTKDEKLSLLKDILLEVRKVLMPECNCCIFACHFILTNNILDDGNEILVFWQNIPSVANLKQDTFDMEFDNNGLFYIHGHHSDVSRYIELIVGIFELNLATFGGSKFSNVRVYLS